MNETLLILGSGYVGEHLRARHPEALATRRHPQAGTIRFDLSDRSTWSALPQTRAVLWTFPAAPLDLVRRFREEQLRDVTTLIVLGSTSAYANTEADAWVDERNPLDLSQPRVAAEEVLRVSGATVLQLAGIWGPGRDPIRWLRDGRIRNGNKYVNLAHVDDIVAAIEAVLSRPCPGERINVCDGQPRRWREHVEQLVTRGLLPGDFQLPNEPPGPDSKRVRNDRLQALLPSHEFKLLTE